MTESKTPTHNQRLGRWGEQAARDYLTTMGLQIVASNVRTAYGEIDVLARQGDMLVFCEVKTRRTRTFGHPGSSCDAQESRSTCATPRWIICKRNDLLDSPWRIDVLAIEKNPAEGKEPVKVTWFQNALSG